jgi:hypothetical protein
MSRVATRQASGHALFPIKYCCISRDRWIGLLPTSCGGQMTLAEKVQLLCSLRASGYLQGSYRPRREIEAHAAAS